jgi:hypothetical protein
MLMSAPRREMIAPSCLFCMGSRHPPEASWRTPLLSQQLGNQAH